MWNPPCHCDCNYEHLLTAGDVSILLEKSRKRTCVIWVRFLLFISLICSQLQSNKFMLLIKIKYYYNF